MIPIKILIIISVVLYLISLFFQTVANYTGLTSLFSGPFGLFLDTKWGVVWLANLFYFAVVFRSLVSSNPSKTFLSLAIISTILACGSFFIDKIIVNEGGSKAVAHLHIGFYLWLSSMVVMVGYNFAIFMKPN